MEEFEYRVNGMEQAGYHVAADTEWMSAEALAKVLTADLVTTRVIDPWELQRSTVVLNDVTHVNIQRGTNAKTLQS